MSKNNRLLAFDEKTIDGIFRNLGQPDLPGAVVGIAIGGTPVYRKGFGLATMELPVTLTPQTRVRIYSITKHITCLAYLLLCEAGRAGVDDTVGKYLPEMNPITHRVTIRQLMSHTSGLRDACDIRWFFSGIDGTVPAPELLALYREIMDSNFAPGEAWCYNNGGYHLLSAIVEKLWEQPLEDVFRKHIFEPLGMYDTLLRRVDTDFVPNSATMHSLGPGKIYEKKFLPGALAGEGGIASTVDDLLRWMRNMANPVVGRPETWALMSSSSRLNNGVETGYGLGLVRRSYRGIDVISHSGGGLGSNSQMIRVPDLDVDVIVSVNRSDVSSAELATRIVDVCLGLESAPERYGAEYLEGMFWSRTTGRVIRFYSHEERQMAAIDGEDGIQIVRSAADEFTPPPSHFSSSAVKWQGATSNPRCVTYHFYGVADELTRLPAGSATGLGSFAGDYRAEAIGVQLTIAEECDGGRLMTRGKFGSKTYRLEGVAPLMWRIRSKDDAVWTGTLTAQAGCSDMTLRTCTNWNVLLRRA